jgi:hypothetical protein
VRTSIAKAATAEPAEGQKLRQRAASASIIVALLVGISVISMAVGRYV